MLALLVRHYYGDRATTGGLSSWWKGDVRLSPCGADLVDCLSWFVDGSVSARRPNDSDIVDGMGCLMDELVPDWVVVLMRLNSRRAMGWR